VKQPRRLAEYGRMVHEVAAITGHARLREIQRYKKGADQKRLAASAMQKVKGRTLNGQPLARLANRGKFQ
jgi:hypothetical protein